MNHPSVSDGGENIRIKKETFPTKEMKAYALEEMIRLVRNMAIRPIQCYSQKVKGQDKQFFLGRAFVEDLIEGLIDQYK
jgi:50S ribosomal subunit-associated GTPase HflX